jgi:Ca-activated chloride channel homolog
VSLQFMRNRAACALLVICITRPAGLAGQGWIEPVRPMPGGRIEKLRSAVQVSVIGRVARVTVEEWFRNTGPILGEGSYLYPLPGEAAFSEFSLWQGDRELKGEVMDATQARSIYEAIVRLKRDPALIELAGHGMVRARVFPIAPGETRKITLRYIQILDRAGDAWRFRYATSRDATPRSFHMTVDSASRIGDPYSPTHHVSGIRRGDQLEVALADSTWSGDLEVFLPLTRGLVGMSLITYRPASETNGYFMMLLAPGPAAERTLHRDVVGVLDISGSMSGDKIDQAKAALVQLVGALLPGDRFRLIAFSSTVRRDSPGWTGVTPRTVRDAQEWVRSLVPEGGTNIADALTEAFAAPPAEGALGVVVFLTDGLPTIGETDPERIADTAERARGQFRVFSFGIGYDVNTFLLDRLTERARGATEYVGRGASIETAVGSLTAKIASPVLTDVALSGDGVELYDLQPGRLPDLFSGDEMVVLGRYRNTGRGPWGATVTGHRASRELHFATRAPADAPAATDYVAHLWAARKAGALGREIRLHGQNPEVMRELKELALRYGILTEYTAYLVQEPGAVAAMPLEDRMPAAPSQQFGAQSVAKARRDAQAANSSVAADVRELDEVTRGRMGGAQTQQVGGRVFVWRDSTWTDLRHGDSLPVVTVAAFSDAYFALLQALPELAKPVALEPTVLVAGRRLSIKIGARGKTVWSEGELDALVRDFRS